MLVPAKLNLYLHITGKKPGGYHLLDSLIVFTDFCDEITISPSSEFSLEISGEFAHLVENDERNIVACALRFMQQEFHIGDCVAIKLVKNIPVGAGLGGGSADAAATLIILNELWQLGISGQELAKMGLNLGADVPIFINRHAAFISGVGEKIKNIHALPELYAVIVYPNQPLSTRDVFKRTNIAAYKKELLKPDGGEILSFLQQQNNDLQNAATVILPEITDIIQMLDKEKACEFARMSGSGSACFGVFLDKQMAQKSLLKITSSNPQYWVRLVEICHRY
jgi:4-diphosphocytidyl-2-C-methyl-D-erythritol kinase